MQPPKNTILLYMILNDKGVLWLRSIMPDAHYVVCSSHLQRSIFQVLLTKLYFYMNIFDSEFVIPIYVVGHRLFSLAPLKNICIYSVHKILGYFHISQSSHLHQL